MVTETAQQKAADRVTFSVEIGVGDLNSGPLTPVTVIVNTGVFYSVLPASLLKGLGLEPREREVYTLPDGSVVEYEVGTARIALDGREWYCQVLFGPEDRYLLGQLTLEFFHLEVEPAERKLVRRVMRGRWL